MAENLLKIGERKKNQEERQKNHEDSFTSSLLTDRAGYATAASYFQYKRNQES